MCENSEKLYIKRVFLLIMTSMILMLLLSVRTEAKTQYDSLTFDAEYYINTYSDVKNAFGNDYQSAYNHFITFGIKEGRRGSPYFDVYYYLNQNSDLQKAFGSNYELAYNHFVNSGINENRAGSPYIDSAYYAKRYPDIKKAFGNDYRGIYYHFYTNGIKEGRKGNIYFDVEYYLTKNKDLENAFGKGNYEAAFNHFLYNGINELRESSSEVNLNCYLASNKDLQNAYGKNKNYTGLFEHCYINGLREKRALTHTIVKIEDVPSTCVTKGQTGGKKCKICGEIIEKPKTINESGHKFQKPEISWNGLTATAKSVCSVCKKEENAHATVDKGVVTKEATCAEEGEKTYTATATYDGKTSTSTITEKIPKTENHTAGNKATFVWSEDDKTATAKFKCSLCGVDLEANVTVDEGVVTKEATCAEEGEKTYTATATYGNKKDTDTKIIKLPIDESKHNWKTTFNWDPHHTSAVVNFVCIHNENHIHEGMPAEITSTEKPATCTENGTITYTATVELDGKKYTDKKVDETESIGHKWSEPKFTWTGISENGVVTGEKISATAEIVCENDNTHKVIKKEKDVTVTKEVKENKKDETVTNIYTATVYFKEIRQEPFIDIVSQASDGMGHIFGEPVFKWADDYTATAKFTCENNSNHIHVVNATVKPEVTTNPTCTTDGITTYTASVDFNGKTYIFEETKTKNEPLKIGHDWNMPKFIWSGIDEKNNTVTEPVKAKAIFSCNNQCNETYEMEVEATSDDIVKPTCISEGMVTYTVKASYDGVTSSESKKITLPPEGHSWGTEDAKITWNNYDSATVKFKCKICSEMSEEIPATITSSETKSATCTEKGEKTYVATATISDNIIVTDTKKQETPAKGHSWGNDYDQDTENGFKRKCTVCGVLEDEAKQLSTEFTAIKCSDIQELDYKAVTGENWTIGSLTQNSKGKVTGKVKEQEVKESKDSNNKINGYYIALTITLNGLDKIPTSINVVPTISVLGASKYYTINENDGKTFKILLQLDRKDCLETCKGDNCSSCKCGKVITISVDADGKNGGYKPTELTIDYCKAEFKKDINVTFEYKDENDELTSKTVTLEDGKITVPSELQSTENFGNKYHKFLYWCDENGSQKFSNNVSNSEITSDTKFTSVYELDFDSFIKDVVDDLNNPNSNISKNYKDIFEISKQGNNITFKVESPSTLISSLNETTIPGAIAYALQKGEVKDITLNLEDKKVVFTKDGANNIVQQVSLDSEGKALKEQIKTGAKKLFNEVLENEEAMTLNDMALDAKSFTLTIGSLDKNVKLKSGANTKYTFDFKTDFVDVSDANTLERALKSDKISHINIVNDFQVTKQYEVNREVVINGEKESNVKHTITMNSQSRNSEDSIFKITSKNVTIDNLKLTGAKKAIFVDGSGTLNSTGLDVSGNTEAGIEVKGQFTGKSLTFTDETYDKPAIKVLSENKKNAKVSITDASVSTLDNYIKVTKHDGKWCKSGNHNSNMNQCTDCRWDDEAEITNNRHYYLTSTNYKKYIPIGFMGITPNGIGGVKYYEEGENIKPLEDGSEITDGSTTYYFIGWSNSRAVRGKANYSNMITDWSNQTATENKATQSTYRYFAVYLERDKKVTIDNTEYYTYKFTDKSDGMTIGELKTIDSKFAEAFKDLQQKAVDKGIIDENDNQKKLVTDETKIDKDMKLIVNNQIDSNTQYKLSSTENLKSNGNNISGIITTKSEDGKYYLPITVTSENFKNNVSTVTVEGPNGGEPVVYTYNEASTSNKSMTINLEAIKSSKITTNNGKVYKLKVDVDGAKDYTYAIKNYTIDYNDVNTLEEIINKAAKRTQEANSLKIIKNNYIKGNSDKYELEYDRTTKRKYLKIDENREEYIFPKSELYPNSTSEVVIYATKTKNEANDPDRVYLNGWRYNSSLKTGYGVFELSLLQDLMRDKSIDAIDRVKKVDGNENTYEITINKERLAEWLDDTYLSSDKITAQMLQDEDVKLIVTLIDNNQYIGSIKTSGNFSIKNYSNNSIDIKIENVETTKIKSPQEMFKNEDETNATDEQIKKFIEDGKKWWEKHTGSTIYGD